MNKHSKHTVSQLISKADIENIVASLAKQISNTYRGQAITLVGVLDGAYTFVSDLARALHARGMEQISVDFVGVDTYGSGTTSSKKAKITKDLKHDIAGKTVLIVEDIVDTGYSLSVLHALLSARNPKSLSTVALLSKDARREVNINVEYIGEHIDDVFVVGYGLDYDGHYRELPYIGVVQFL